MDEELKEIHQQYFKVQIYKWHKLDNNPIKNGIREELANKFDYFKESSDFFLLDYLNNKIKSKDSLKKLHNGLELFFSGKEGIENENSFVRSQLNSNSMMLAIQNNNKFSIVDVYKGGIYYLDKKLAFILIPCEESISIPNAKEFLESLKEIQSKKPPLSSNRGKNKRVLFEFDKSNYVDFGIGISKFFSGIYKKEIKGVSNVSWEHIHNYLNYIEEISKKYLPKCLLDKFNKVLKDINMDNFNEALSYKSKMERAKANYSFTSNINTNKQEYTFMPSTSFGINNFLPMHTDKDMFLSVVHVHSEKDINKDTGKYYKYTNIIKYFTFEDGTSVGLRSGDLLIFNPTIDHCISTSTIGHENEMNYCISHYFKTAVAGMNNNSIKFKKEN